MLKHLLFIIVLTFSIKLNAQTIIANTKCINAIANSSQRKIVRFPNQDLFVVYEDSLNNNIYIQAKTYNSITNTWSSTNLSILGHSPSLAIGQDSKIHILYVTNDSISLIKYCNYSSGIISTPFTVSNTNFISDIPVVDVDFSNNINVFWKQKDSTNSYSLNYACISNDSIVNCKKILTKTSIEDISIANHLQYFDNILYFGVQYNSDSTTFYNSTNYLQTKNTILTVKGSHPRISYNSYYDNLTPLSAKLLYNDTCNYLIENEIIDNDFNNILSFPLQGPVSGGICIDDIAMPFGYSYLFMQNNNLYHSFSFGPNYPMYCILDTISTNPFNPSIAYKSFNSQFIDFIWMEVAESGYNILYKRDSKYIWENVKPIKPDDEISVYGYPNPFSDNHYFTVETKIKTPEVSIYNTKGEQIVILHPISIYNNKYCYNWNGCIQSGKRASEGSYIIRCVAGNKIAVRKIVLEN